MISLIRFFPNSLEENWIVKTTPDTGDKFKTIEEAAEFMNALGISDDDIDAALVDLYSFNHRCAVFNNNKYINSQDL